MKKLDGRIKKLENIINNRKSGFYFIEIPTSDPVFDEQNANHKNHYQLAQNIIKQLNDTLLMGWKAVYIKPK